MKRLRVYVDTSVVGGCFDDEFAHDSNRLIEAARLGRLTLLVSVVVANELAGAPAQVADLLEGLPFAAVEDVALTPEVFALRDAYLRARILGSRWADDALHVAAATVHRADAIVSWNFKHIVRLDKMKAYNRVNAAEGYGMLTIVTPREVMGHGDRNHSKGI
jgi:predicted nucleic acid-binding protein